MLAAKSSCKDRWPQILPEADRIEVKHLCTLDVTLTAAGIEEMTRKRVVPVIPRALHEAYSPRQRDRFMTVQAFLEHVRQLVANGSGATFSVARSLFTQ